MRAEADVAEAELVGLAPRAALEGFPADVPLRGFSPERHLVEEALEAVRVTSLSDGPDQAQAHAKAPRHPRGDDRAGGPHRAPRRHPEGREADRAPAPGGAHVHGPPPGAARINRAAIAAAVFGVLVVVVFKRDVAQGAALAAVMLLIYIPLGYTTDLALYRFRERRRAAARK